MAIHQPGVPDKYPKVHHNPNLSSGVLGIHSGHGDHDDIAPNAQDPCDPEGGISPPLTEEGASEGLGMSHWDTGSNQASCMDGVSTLSCPTRLEGTITLAASVRSDSCESVRGGMSRSSMVVFRPEFQLLSHDGEARSLNSDRVRCLQVRLGSSLPGGSNWWQWTSEEAGLHINLLELQAVFLALQSFLKDKTKVAVLVRSDDRTAIAYLNKMGSPTRSQLCLLALEIWEWCLLRQISPHAEYLAGKDNVLADWESCHHDSSDWQLLPSVFEAINHLLGPFTIDLFASRTNAQLPVYCSWRPDPQARVVDAFSITWSQDQPYLFPPFNLIGKALTKIRIEEVDFACLIAPAWPAQVWYSQVLRMLVGNPVLLPMEQDLLLSPVLSPHPLILENRMFLTAWPVSGRVSRHRVFSERVTELLLQSWRSNTHSTWSKWCGWCFGRLINPLSASLGNILEFLADQFDLGLQYRSLNTLRSAISNSHSQIDSVNVGSHPIVSRLLKGMFNARPPAPRYSGSWDVAIVVEYLRSCPSESLSILELGKKVITLMALANASRCSDLAALDRDY